MGGGGAAGDKGPGEAATSPAEETVVWSPEVEVCLFHAMLGHKPVGERAPRTCVGGGARRQRPGARAGRGPLHRPCPARAPPLPLLCPFPTDACPSSSRPPTGAFPAGVNRHFHMICIRDKFSQNIGRQVPSKVIWDHLSTMYDMQALVSWTPPSPSPKAEPSRPRSVLRAPAPSWGPFIQPGSSEWGSGRHRPSDDSRSPCRTDGRWVMSESLSGEVTPSPGPREGALTRASDLREVPGVLEAGRCPHSGQVKVMWWLL